MNDRRQKKRVKERPGLTWKEWDNALFGVLLPSLDWELVKKLHLGEKQKCYIKTHINTKAI